MASQETRTGDRLLLLDGHSLAYRAFFALPVENFSTTTGQPTNAVYGFTAMLINVLRDEKPTHVAVAFDRGEPTFRHEQWVEYKANRRETPEDFRSQLSLIFEVLDALGIRRLSAPGYEADLKESYEFALDLPLTDPDVAAGLPLHGPNRWPPEYPWLREAAVAFPPPEGAETTQRTAPAAQPSGARKGAGRPVGRWP